LIRRITSDGEPFFNEATGMSDQELAGLSLITCQLLTVYCNYLSHFLLNFRSVMAEYVIVGDSPPLFRDILHRALNLQLINEHIYQCK